LNWIHEHLLDREWWRRMIVKGDWEKGRGEEMEQYSTMPQRKLDWSDLEGMVGLPPPVERRRG